MLEDLQAHVPMITRALVLGLVSIILCYILGFSREQAIFPVLMTMAFTLLIPYVP